MIYYNLHSEYPGDETKGCSLTIDEVDSNFYELETRINTLEKKLTDLTLDVSNLMSETKKMSYTMHDSIICPPGISNDAIYQLYDNFKYKMQITGVISYYGEPIPNGDCYGNFFGVVIMPKYCKQKYMFPDAIWYINDIEMGNIWDEISNNQQECEPALYLYPKVERIDGNVIVSINYITNNTNKITVTIKWDEINDETYTYTVDENVVIEEPTLSRTVHDGVICPPGTSDSASYTIIDDGHTMEIGGEISYDYDRNGYTFGVAIEPLYETSYDKYPNAIWYINDNEIGNLWDEIYNGGGDCQVSAIYLYPVVDRTASGNIVINLYGYSNCSNTLSIKIDWDNNRSETYTYIVKEDIIFI